ncbi:MAG: hypothetical protein AAFO87_07665 [Cyanobacteria bacterium J06607_6]
MAHSAASHSTLPHLRLTPSEIFRFWQSGHYSPKGYLYHLAMAHRRAGWWWRIDNITEFCRKWDIKRRTFYRAKAALVHEGIFEETITSSIALRVCTASGHSAGDTGVSNEGPTVTHESQRVPDLAQSVSDGSQSSPETTTQQGIPEAPDLVQIFKQLPTSEERCVTVESFVLEKEEEPEKSLPTHFEKEIKQCTSQASTEKIFTPPILQRAKKLGVNVSDRSLLAVVEKWPDRVSVALDCLEEKQLTVKHPTRFLQKAIEQDWRPEKSASAPTGFGDWFNEARRRGLAIASEMRNDILHVFTADEHWLPFEQLRRMTWDELSARMKPINTGAIDVQASPILGT